MLSTLTSFAIGVIADDTRTVPAVGRKQFTETQHSRKDISCGYLSRDCKSAKPALFIKRLKDS